MFAMLMNLGSWPWESGDLVTNVGARFKRNTRGDLLVFWHFF